MHLNFSYNGYLKLFGKLIYINEYFFGIPLQWDSESNKVIPIKNKRLKCFLVSNFHMLIYLLFMILEMRRMNIFDLFLSVIISIGYCYGVLCSINCFVQRNEMKTFINELNSVLLSLNFSQSGKSSVLALCKYIFDITGIVF